MYHKAQCYASDQEAQRKSSPEGKEGISMSACSLLLFPAHPRLRERKAWRRRGEPPVMGERQVQGDEPVPEQARRPAPGERGGAGSSPPGSVFRSSALFARNPCSIFYCGKAIQVILAYWANWQRNTRIAIRQETCQAEVPCDDTRNDPEVATDCLKRR